MALLLCIGSHLRPALDFTVDGVLIESGCSLAAARLAREAALMAAEEILPGHAVPEPAKRHIRLSLKRPADTAPELGAALLESCGGVIRGEAVYLGQTRLGCVKDGGALCRSLNRYIENTLPTWANSGHLSQGFMLCPVFTRAEYEVSNEDMLMLLTGLAPVMYTDGKGRVSPV